MPHPATLWQDQPGFEIVRPMGMQTMHQRREGEDAALCGLAPPEVRGKRWSVYNRLGEAPYCEACWIAWGKLGVQAGTLSKTTIQEAEAWPFPVTTPKPRKIGQNDEVIKMMKNGIQKKHRALL